MTKIKLVRFNASINFSGHLKPEAKEMYMTDGITAEQSALGVTFTWRERNYHDAHADISKNPLRSTFVPMTMVQQIEFEPQEIISTQLKPSSYTQDTSKVIANLAKEMKNTKVNSKKN